MTTQFDFLQYEWPAVHEAADKAAAAVQPDARAACFYARRSLEIAVAWAYKHDTSLRLPYQDNLSALIHEPTFKAVTGDAVFSKARLINRLGNQAVHSHRPIQQSDALIAVRQLFHFVYWFCADLCTSRSPGARTELRSGRAAHLGADSQADDRAASTIGSRPARARRKARSAAR